MDPTQTNSSKDFDEHSTRDDSEGKGSHIPLWQSIKTFPRIVGYCLALSSAILLYGYDLVIVGTVAAMPQFQYVYTLCNNRILSR
jgi:hypothetical protein